MDLNIAYTGLKAAKETFDFLLSTKIEAESRTKVLEALRILGDAQDQLFQLREELFRLQSENQALKTQISKAESWDTRISNYELSQTDGGAIVYKSKSKPEHFVCPSCTEKKEIHILQDARKAMGTFTCPGCDKLFPVKKSRVPGSVNLRRG